MLIRFTVENFLSFNGPIEFSMYPGRATSHKNHKYIDIKQKKYNRINVLKHSLIYGANASGKSNLVKALDYAKKFIVKGIGKDKPINFSEFKLDIKAKEKPAMFQFEIKVKGKNYSYGFKINKEIVIEEWLYEFTKTSEKLIFKRITNEDGEKSIQKPSKIMKNEDDMFFEFIFRGTNPNKLFLTEYNEKTIDIIKPLNDVYDWFSSKLNVIFPEDRFLGLLFFLQDIEFEKDFEVLLNYFDTGIDEIKLEDIGQPIEDLPFPKELIEKIIADLKPNVSAMLESKRTNELYTFSMDKDKNIEVRKLRTRHTIKDSDEICSFEINEESDGTKRMMDLIPALLMLLNEDAVFVIDELDRSLHPSISSQFIKIFSEFTKGRPSQLICTTHDSNLLNLNNLRRDEIWFMEKNKYGESNLYSLEEFKIRRDFDIRNGYLLGRFGGIPYEQNIDNLKELING